MAWTAEKRRDYMKQWHKDHPGYIRQWCHKNPTKVRAWHAAWEKRNYAKLAAWRKAHRHIMNARYRVYTAVKTGKLIRPKNCSKCGAMGQIHAHHNDYSKPLEVEWLCYPCHLAKHGKSVRTLKILPPDCPINDG